MDNFSSIFGQDPKLLSNLYKAMEDAVLGAPKENTTSTPNTTSGLLSAEDIANYSRKNPLSDFGKEQTKLSVAPEEKTPPQQAQQPTQSTQPAKPTTTPVKRDNEYRMKLANFLMSIADLQNAWYDPAKQSQVEANIRAWAYAEGIDQMDVDRIFFKWRMNAPKEKQKEQDPFMDVFKWAILIRMLRE